MTDTPFSSLIKHFGISLQVESWSLSSNFFLCLDISRAFQLSASCLIETFPRLPNLRCLSLRGLQVTDPVLKSLLTHCTKLLQLNLFRCCTATYTHETQQMFGRLTEVCTTLEALDIGYFAILENEQLTSLLSKAPNVSAKKNQSTETLFQLIWLGLQKCYGVDDSTFKALARCKQLQVLDISQTEDPKRVDPAYSLSSVQQVFATCTLLKSVDMSHVTSINADEGEESICS